MQFSYSVYNDQIFVGSGAYRVSVWIAGVNPTTAAATLAANQVGLVASLGTALVTTASNLIFTPMRLPKTCRVGSTCRSTNPACGACNDGVTCNANSQCFSGLCQDGTCASATLVRAGLASISLDAQAPFLEFQLRAIASALRSVIPAFTANVRVVTQRVITAAEVQVDVQAFPAPGVDSDNLIAALANLATNDAPLSNAIATALGSNVFNSISAGSAIIPGACATRCRSTSLPECGLCFRGEGCTSTSDCLPVEGPYCWARNRTCGNDPPVGAEEVFSLTVTLARDQDVSGIEVLYLTETLATAPGVGYADLRARSRTGVNTQTLEFFVYGGTGVDVVPLRSTFILNSTARIDSYMGYLNAEWLTITSPAGFPLTRSSCRSTCQSADASCGACANAQPCTLSEQCMSGLCLAPAGSVLAASRSCADLLPGDVAVLELQVDLARVARLTRQETLNAVPSAFRDGLLGAAAFTNATLVRTELVPAADAAPAFLRSSFWMQFTSSAALAGVESVAARRIGNVTSALASRLQSTALEAAVIRAVPIPAKCTLGCYSVVAGREACGMCVVGQECDAAADLSHCVDDGLVQCDATSAQCLPIEGVDRTDTIRFEFDSGVSQLSSGQRLMIAQAVASSVGRPYGTSYILSSFADGVLTVTVVVFPSAGTELVVLTNAVEGRRETLRARVASIVGAPSPSAFAHVEAGAFSICRSVCKADNPSCSVCANGKPCSAAGDCASGLCQDNQCFLRQVVDTGTLYPAVRAEYRFDTRLTQNQLRFFSTLSANLTTLQGKIIANRTVYSEPTQGTGVFYFYLDAGADANDVIAALGENSGDLTFILSELSNQTVSYFGDGTEALDVIPCWQTCKSSYDACGLCNGAQPCTDNAHCLTNDCRGGVCYNPEPPSSLTPVVVRRAAVRLRRDSFLSPQQIEDIVQRMRRDLNGAAELIKFIKQALVQAVESSSTSQSPATSSLTEFVDISWMSSHAGRMRSGFALTSDATELHLEFALQANASAGVSSESLGTAVADNQAVILDSAAQASGSEALAMSSEEEEVLSDCLAGLCVSENPSCFLCNDGKPCTQDSECVSDYCHANTCSVRSAAFAAGVSWAFILSLVTGCVAAALSVLA